MARDQGNNVWSSYYPWTAGSGNYGASIIAPENWEGSMGYKYEDTIFDPQLDRFVTKDEFLSFAENEPGRTAIVFSPPREQWLNDWITIAGYGISGDGMAGLDIEGNLDELGCALRRLCRASAVSRQSRACLETRSRSECAADAHTHSAKLHPCEAIGRHRLARYAGAGANPRGHGRGHHDF